MGEKWKALPKEEREKYQSGLVQPPYSGRGGSRAWRPIDALSAGAIDAKADAAVHPPAKRRATGAERQSQHLDGDPHDNPHEVALAAATALLRSFRPASAPPALPVRAQALPAQAAPAEQGTSPGEAAVAVGTSEEELDDRLLQEQLARIRGSWTWSQENQASQLA